MTPCLTIWVIRFRSRVIEAIEGKELRPSLHLGELGIDK